MGHEGEVLDEAATLALGRVAGTEHAPLRGLQRPGTAHLTRLLKLGVHSEQIHNRTTPLMPTCLLELEVDSGHKISKIIRRR